MKRLSAALALLLLAGCSTQAPKTLPAPINVKPVPQQPAPAPAPPTKWHPEVAGNVARLDISNASSTSGPGRKTVSDKEAVQRVLDVLKQAQFSRPVRREDSPPGAHWILTFVLKDGSFLEADYYPGGPAGNLADIQTQTWWSVPGLEEALKPLLPSITITLEQAESIGRSVDAEAEWWPRLAEKGSLPVDGDQVWLLAGLRKDGARLIVYVDPVSGKILRQNPPETTDAAVAAVREFFRLTAAGDYKAAWPLLHEQSRQPRGGQSEADLRSRFEAQQGGPALGRVLSAAWHRDYWKYYDCQCMLFDVVDVTVEVGGKTEVVHVAPDRDGAWRVFWSWTNGGGLS